MPDAAFIYSDKLSQFDYGDDHPFKPIRARNAMELCNRHGLLYAIGVKRPDIEPATKEDLLLFHTKEYVETLLRANSGGHDLSMLEAGIGTPDCPVLPGIYDFSLLVTGATLHGVKMVEAGESNRAFNMVGGLHHAAVDHAEGFCYVNDVGVAIDYLLKNGRRPAFIDIDAHHCNGIQDRYYNDDRVMVISLHEYGEQFYPETGAVEEIGEGKGKGYNINLPLMAMTDDEVYTKAFNTIVPPLIDSFKPDIVIAEIGADTIISDPLTHLRLTSNGYEATVKKIVEISPSLVCVGGGGYDIFRTSRNWTLAWAALCELPAEDEYAGLVGGMMYGSEDGGLQDPKILTKGLDKENAMNYADNMIKYIKDNVFPIHNIKS